MKNLVKTVSVAALLAAFTPAVSLAAGSSLATTSTPSITSTPGATSGANLPSGAPNPHGASNGAVTGVQALSGPSSPQGFDPTKAAPQQLLQYGYPPAPPAGNDKAQQAWRTVVTTMAKKSAGKGQIKSTSIYHGPVKPAKSSTVSTPNQSANQAFTFNGGAPLSNIVGNGNVKNVGAITTGASYNWSGSAVYDGKNPFSAGNNPLVFGEFTVPDVHQAFYTCGNAWDYSSYWVGIDGFNSNDVFQAGIEADAYCGAVQDTYYGAWIEWYPYSEYAVSQPAVHPGDEMYVYVYPSSSTAGYALLFNLSTLDYGYYYFTAPSGTTLVGNSVEWVVERPGVNGGLATLSNYVHNEWIGALAYTNYGGSYQYFYPYAYPPLSSSTLYLLTMLDNNGAGISSFYPLNPSALEFYNYGSSY